MTIRPPLRALTGLAAATTLALPAVASAQTFSHTDPAHDVQMISDGRASTSAANKKADIIRVKLTHTSTEVTGRVKLRALDTSYDWSLISEIKTPKRKYVVLVRHTGHRTQVTLALPGGTPVTCNGLARQLKPARRVVAYTVPATCLARPRWVQVGIGFTVPVGSTGAYADDGLTKSQADGRHLTLSKRLHT